MHCARGLTRYKKSAVTDLPTQCFLQSPAPKMHLALSFCCFSFLIAGCGDADHNPSSSPSPTAPAVDNPSTSVAWAAQVKTTLEPMIESELGLRNRIMTNGAKKSIKVVFLELPPRTVPKEMPNGEIKEVLNPNGAPSRIKLLVRDVIEESRLDIASFEMLNGKLNPDDPKPFQ